MALQHVLSEPNFLRCLALPKEETHDRELVRRVKAGDESAFREIVESYSRKIYRLVYGILRNAEDAEDIAQDVFAKAYFSIGDFGGRSSLFSWLYRIALNACYGFLRKKRVRAVLGPGPNGEAADLALEMCADGRPAIDQTVAARDLVIKLLARLPEEDRMLLLWKEVEGFSVSQIAAMTGANQNTVKVRILRARRKLADAASKMSRRSIR